MAWDGSWTLRPATPPPLVADEPVRRHEADPIGRQPRLARDAQHLQPNQVVGERKPPQLLPHSLRLFAADVLAPLEHLRLHLVVAELDLPALVIKRRQLLGGILLRVEE